MAHSLGANTLRMPATGNASTANPRSGSFTCPAGTTVLWVGVGCAGTTARTGGAPTYNGLALTQLGSQRNNGGTPEAYNEHWYLLNPPVGASLTLSIPNDGAIAIGAFVATAAAANGFESVLDTQTGASGSSTNPAASITVSAAGNAVFAVCTNGAATFAPSAQSGTAILPTGTNDFSSWGIAAQMLITGSSGATDTNWTFGTSEDWAISNASFAESAILEAAGSKQQRRRRRHRTKLRHAT